MDARGHGACTKHFQGCWGKGGDGVLSLKGWPDPCNGWPATCNGWPATCNGWPAPCNGVRGQTRRRSFVVEGLARPLHWLASHLQWLASPWQRARAVRRGSCRILLGSRSDPIAPSARRTIAKWTQTRVYWSVGSRRIPLGSCVDPAALIARRIIVVWMKTNVVWSVGSHRILSDPTGIPSDPVGSRSDPMAPIARRTIVE